MVMDIYQAVVAALVGKGKVYTESRDGQGNTALHWCVHVYII